MRFLQARFNLCSILILYALSFLAVATPQSAAWASEPTAKIPWAERSVKIDGQVNAEEWSDSAELTFELRPETEDGYGRILDPLPLPVSTRVWVKYDQESLWLGIICDETDANYPAGYPRTYIDDLTLDDAVQVVLGTADQNDIAREVINVGGYKDALNTAAAKADHYYQFTVNAVNAKSRTYNEVPMERAGFDSAVKTRGEGRKWSIEMRIPFASLGFRPEAGETLYANLLRYRPPGRSGWHLPRFGGYAPMPFGTFELLPQGQSEERTIEPVVEAPDRAKHEVKAVIGYYPLSGTISGTVQQIAPIEGYRAVLEVEGLGTRETTVERRLKEHLAFDITPGAQPERYAELKIYDSKNKVVAQASRALEAVDEKELPEWFETDAGISYVDNTVPQPWKSPQVSGDEIELLNRILHVGESGMFSSSGEGIEDVLAGDAVWIIESRGQPLDYQFSNQSFSVETTAARSQTVGVLGNAALETRLRIEYDGFTTVKFHMPGLDARELTRLSLRLPLNPANAKFVHRFNVQDIRALHGFGYDAPAGRFWVGSEERGLSFLMDTPAFFSNDIRRQVRVVEEQGEVYLELNFIDGPDQVVDAEPVFRFFLQPTPVKPVSLEKIYPRRTWEWEWWSDHQGYPQVDAKMDWLKEFTSKGHAHGQEVLLYTCQGLAEDSPGFERWREDLMIQPAWMFYKRKSKQRAGYGVPSWACDKRGPEGDLQLWAFERMAKEAGLNGIVSDGLSFDWKNESPGLRHGGVRSRTPLWDEDLRSRTTEQRRFLKRLRGVFDEQDRPYHFHAHTGGGLDIHTLSLFDSYREGEHLQRYRPGYFIPTAMFAVGYSGRPWGFRTVFWDKKLRRQWGVNWSLTQSLLHDVEVNDTEVTNRVFYGFTDDNETTFHPYWQPSDQVKIEADTSLCSYYTKSDAALVIVGNPVLTDDRIQLDLSELIAGRDMMVEELVNGQPISLIDGVLTADLPGYRCIAIRLSDRASQADAIDAGWHETGYESEHWQLVGKRRGVSMKPISLDDGIERPQVLTEMKKDRGDIAFALPIAPQGTARLRIKHSGRLRVSIGDSYYQWYKTWSHKNFVRRRPTVDLNPRGVTDRFVTLEVSVDGGRVDITYDGQPLARTVYLPDQQPRQLVLSTWAGDSLVVDPIEMSSRPIPLYVGGVSSHQVAHVSKAEPFDITGHHPDDWKLNTEDPGVESRLLDDHTIQLISPPKGAFAVAKLAEYEVGRNLTIALRFKLERRFALRIGSVRLTADNGWRITGPVSGWSQGKIYPGPIDSDQEHELVVSIRDGVLDAIIDGRVLARDMEFDLAEGEQDVALETWAGNRISFTIDRVSSEPTVLVEPPAVKHPIR